MWTSNLTELDWLKIIYLEIINGFSYLEKYKVFVKHFSELDNIHIANFKKNLFQKLNNDGIPSYQDRLKEIIQNEEWSQKKEDHIEFLKLNIIDNEKNKNSIILPQRAPIERVINEKKSELSQLLLAKRTILGATAEEFAERDTISYIAYYSLYKDEQCLIRYFNNFQDFQMQNDEVLEDFIEEIDKVLTKFSELNIRKIACMSFFINIFSYCKDDISNFLRLPVVKMSNYQFSLIALASRNLNILTNTEGEPPPLLNNKDIEKTIDWYDKQYSLLNTKVQTNNQKK